MRYQDIYPTGALLSSAELVRPRAAELLNLEYFEAKPDAMPAAAFSQHHLLLNLKEEPHRLENRRGGTHRDFTFRKDEVVITPAMLESGWRWHAKSRVIVVTIEPDKLGRFVASEMGLTLTPRQLRDVPLAHDPVLVEAGSQLLAALRERGPGHEVMYESLARVFLVKLIQGYAEDVAASGPTAALGATRLRRVLDFVSLRFGQPIAIEDLAAEAGLSPSRFSRVFREMVGASPHQYVMDYRVEQARLMLRGSDRPLIDVALSCGFADQPHFTRIFRRIAGVTPREYRLAVQESSKDRAEPSRD